MTMTVHPLRAVVLVSGSGAAAWLLGGQGLTLAAAPPTLESTLTAAIALGGATAALAISVATLAALAEGLLGWRPRAARALPGPLRRFLVTTVVAAVATGVAVPATADEVYPGWAPAVVTSPSPTPLPPSPAASPSPVATQEPEPEPAPDEPAIELHAESAAPALEDEHPAGGDHEGGDHDGTDHGGTDHNSTVHTVVRGESLWRIAADALGPDATDAAIARAWPLIYQANRATIGDDPGLILPGQTLAIPHAVAP